MRGVKRFVAPICGVAVVVLAACGSDAEPASVVTEPEGAVVEPDSVAAESEVADPPAMTIEALCDPLDAVVLEWVGADVERKHSDLLAVDDPAALVCEWVGAPDYREVRVVYHASPEVWDATVAAGGGSLEALDADNVYDGEILSAHAENGWTVDVIAFEGDPPVYVDAPDVVVPIAAVALGATS